MQVEQLSTASGNRMDGPLLITPQVFGDARGFFYESWNQRRFDQAVGHPISFSQDNHSRSSRGVLRGLHYQLEPEPQGKLVRCPVGAICDVAVDLRRSSPTFGQWVGAELSGENHRQLWVPVGFAHGFLTLSVHAEVLYKASGFWSKTCERSLRWSDPEVGITWPLDRLVGVAPLLADKGAAAHSAALIEDLDLPGYRLHPLKGADKGRWSIWVNGNWRLTFAFRDGHVFDLDFEDYH